MGTFFRENQAGYLTFDNVLEEEYSRPATVTAHPIERSAQVTDHRVKEQLVLTVTGLVTETPMEAFLTQGFDRDTIGESHFFAGSINAGNNRRSLAAVSFFEVAENELLEYYSYRLGFVSNLLVRNISYKVTNKLELIFNIEAVEVEFSESQTVDLPPLATRRKRPASCPTTNTGSKGTPALDGAVGRDLDIAQTAVEFLTGRKSGDAVDALSEFVTSGTDVSDFNPLGL